MEHEVETVQQQITRLTTLLGVPQLTRFTPAIMESAHPIIAASIAWTSADNAPAPLGLGDELPTLSSVQATPMWCDDGNPRMLALVTTRYANDVIVLEWEPTVNEDVLCELHNVLADLQPTIVYGD